LNDYQGAFAYIDDFLKRFPQFPFAPMLRLRQIAYVERWNGFDEAKPLYKKFVNEERDAAAVEQAKLLLWFHEKPTRAIAMLYTTMPAEAFIDGQSLVKSEKADAPVAVGFELAEGAHCLAVRAAFQPYPSWIQFAIRTHKGLYGTAPAWKNKGNPEGDWTQPAYDDTHWPIVGGLGMKGPPDEAYVWMPPNALIDMNAKVTALHGEARLVENNQGFIAFRTRWAHP
jgi:hypothetical protein